MYVIAGLGNPGRKYAKTRHNVGFDTLDIVADRYRIDIGTEKFRSLCGTGEIDGQKVILVKPQTFMNLSGESLRLVCDYYKINVEEELIVIYDDISLTPGQIRVRKKGSAGGHNGVKSIIQNLGTEVFKRVKVGIGAPPVGYTLVDYVLGHFPFAERIEMEDAFDRAARAAAALLTKPAEQVMNEYNRVPE